MTTQFPHFKKNWGFFCFLEVLEHSLWSEGSYFPTPLTELTFVSHELLAGASAFELCPCVTCAARAEIGPVSHKQVGKYSGNRRSKQLRTGPAIWKQYRSWMFEWHSDNLEHRESFPVGGWISFTHVTRDTSERETKASYNTWQHVLCAISLNFSICLCCIFAAFSSSLKVKSSE